MTSRAGTARAAGLSRWTLVVGLALTGVSMRTAVSSVGAALDDVEHGLHTGNGTAGLLTMLPVLCFAGLGSVAPVLARRFGPHRMLVSAMGIMTLGLFARVLVSHVWSFLALSVLALAGGAISNVLLPSLVKAHFPTRIGTMTALYTTALAVGTTAAAGLTVPIGSLSGGSDHGWRFGLGAWGVVAALAILPWLPTVVHDHPLRNGDTRPAHVPTRLWHSPTAWALTAFFAFQSLQAYIAFGWFAKFMRAHGISAAEAGWMVALLSAVTIPMSMLVPNVHVSRHTMTIVILNGCYLLAYTGMAVAPVDGAWAWMVLAGIGSAQFPLVLAMIGLRSRTPETTAALSAFVQSIGYLVAGSGPLLFGLLYDTTGSWALPMSLLFVGMAGATLTGARSARPCYVDDELARSAA